MRLLPWANKLPTLLLLLICLTLAWQMPLWVVLMYSVASVLCYFAYRADKSAARAGQWRTRERTLLLFGLIGGWPGALLAQQTLRHKSRKFSFQFWFWCSVLLNLAVLVYLNSPWNALLRP
ncbi:MAG: DUF1294 domain-containing protein [Burkholderiales bacterium]|nr:DUF1294 domain-containing protein [Burkholderiales bacterium]